MLFVFDIYILWLLNVDMNCFYLKLLAILYFYAITNFIIIIMIIVFITFAVIIFIIVIATISSFFNALNFYY